MWDARTSQRIETAAKKTSTMSKKRERKMAKKMSKEKFPENPVIKVTDKKSKSKKVTISPPPRRGPSKENKEDKRPQE
jgi:hypothetical protein